MMTSVIAPETAISELEKFEDVKIIELADAIRPKEAQSSHKRTSRVSEDSADAFENATPAGLAADLIHYKELFSKLRFSYVEQVTKEKFLKAITDNPPLFVDANDNQRLEAQLVEAKASLKAQKVEVAELLKDLEDRGRELSQRHESINLRSASLSELPSQIADLESRITDLQNSLDSNTQCNPSLALPLPDTLALLQDRQSEISSLNSQLAQLQAAVPRKNAELEKLEAELRPLEIQKKGVVREAMEARKRREEGGGLGDELEERGRWYRAAEKGLREMLEVDA